MTQTDEYFHLRLVGQHMWLRPGDVDIEIPAIATVCGANGTGKSTLLGAINGGSAQVSGPQGPLSSTKLFSLGELGRLVPDSGYYDPTDSPSQFDTYSRQLGASQEAYHNMIQSGEPPQTDEQRRTVFSSYLTSSGIISPSAFAKIIRESGHDVFSLTREDFDLYGPLYPVRDPFSMSLSQTFVRYADIVQDNAFRLFRRDSQGESVAALSDEEFRAQHGPPPWELMDDALRTIGLAYSVTPPPTHGKAARDQFVCQFVNEEGEELGVDALSSGERTLLTLVLSTYQRDRAVLTSSFPEILLLDEADASLHPSYIVKFFRILREILWKQLGVRSILTTHSPSTAVLSEDGSTFEMVRSVPRLISVGRDRAVASLSSGVPTLAVRLENQYQVIVEAPTDKAVYQIYFSSLQSLLQTEKNLEFIAVGAANDTGGNTAVRSWVRRLRAAGNASTFGLVDRDTSFAEENYIDTIGDRYSLENLVLDPPQLAAYVLKYGDLRPEELGLPEGTRYFEIDATTAQTATDYLCRLLGIGGDLVTVSYVGNFDINIPSAFLDMRGHDLEALVAAQFPSTRHPSNGQKVFLYKIATLTGNELNSLLPLSLVSLFRRILSSI